MLNSLDFFLNQEGNAQNPVNFVQDKLTDLTNTINGLWGGETNGYQSLDVTVDGVTKTLYRQTGDNNTGSGDWIHFGGPDGMSINASDQLGPNNFFMPNLLGGKVSFDVDLSQMECGCVAAFYLVRMPAKNWDGSYIPGPGGDYYCDANQVGGTFCPEFDIMEANQYAFQTTPHTCNSPTDQGHYDWCDKGGQCHNNTKDMDWNTLGPGDQY